MLENLTMPQSVDVSDQLEDVVTKSIASGHRGSEDPVLRQGARLIQERQARMASLDQAIAKGIEAVGDAEPASEVFARLDAKYRALAESAR
jgi:antitoxin ParD1/3/4